MLTEGKLAIFEAANHTGFVSTKTTISLNVSDQRWILPPFKSPPLRGLIFNCSGRYVWHSGGPSLKSFLCIRIL